jgi:hypothetical protein
MMPRDKTLLLLLLLLPPPPPPHSNFDTQMAT